MNVGIIGAGKIAKKHINSLQKFNGVNIAVSDKRSEKARQLAKDLGVSHEDSSASLIESNSVDVVHVCTPVRTHLELIKKAAKKGKHIFCEKPLCESTRHAYEIKGAVEANEVVLSVGYLYRFHPAIRELKRIIDEGIIGNVYSANLRLGARGSHKEWKHKKDTGGGVINEISVHKLDLANWLFGRVRSVDAVKHSLELEKREIDGKKIDATANDFLTARIDMEKCSVTLNTDIFTHGFVEFIEVMGTNGSVFTSILDYMPTTVYLHEAKDKYESGQNKTFYKPVDLFERQFQRFFGAIKGECENLNSVSESIKTMECIGRFKYYEC
ncbi:putative dehydrogenase [Salinibacter ruber]|uniref:Gfo/Idh/MocA family protein n=1 Tax=Salinibacter ruber TaxID=146919 RepID=UPI002168B868|nr:Gfo/Idh/MocA family oxidoreductase [Salinibacter ruber]MCS3856503.1 putative dehydrogenase [Salinibacter ruber]